MINRSLEEIADGMPMETNKMRRDDRRQTRIENLPWVWIGFKATFGGFLCLALLYFIALILTPAAFAGTQTFTATILEGNIDGTQRSVATLTELRLFCEVPNQPETAELFYSVPLTLEMPGDITFEVFNNGGTYDCAARTVTSTGILSPRSNVVQRTWEESRPSAPVLQ